MDLFVYLPVSALLTIYALHTWEATMTHDQRTLDRERSNHSIVFPTGLKQDQVLAFINSIGGALVSPSKNLRTTRTAVFEVIADATGITHRARLPEMDAHYLVNQLDAHMPGIEVMPFDEPIEDEQWTTSARIMMSDPTTPLRIAKVGDSAARILKALQVDSPNEKVILQWVVANTTQEKTEAGKPPSALQLLIYGAPPRAPRQTKQPELHFAVVGRIAATAPTEEGARRLVHRVLTALQAENHLNRFYLEKCAVMDVVAASTPTGYRTRYGNLMTASELLAVSGFPVDDPQIAGLSQGASRRLPATESIPRTGAWHFGTSDVPGRERPVAITDKALTHHMVVTGTTGTGKTWFLTNGAVDLIGDPHTRRGLIVIDAGVDISRERLYYRVLDTLPPSRINDVVCINPVDDAAYPVAINLLDQGFGMGIIEQITGVLAQLYPEINSGVSVRELLHHGLWTLIEHGGCTLLDLAALLSPANDTEFDWAIEVIKGVQDPELKDFWARYPGAISKSPRDRGEWMRYVEPIHRRIWQLSSRPEIRNILGQTHSTVQMREIISEGKILLISLGGMDVASAQLVGSLLTNLVWSTVQVVDTPYLMPLMFDEFQVASNVQGGLSDMLARGRVHQMPVILATQFLSKPDISESLRSAALSNTGTKIVLRATSTKEADEWSRNLGRQLVTDSDVKGLKNRHAVATIDNDRGDTTPVTFEVAERAPYTGIADQVVTASRARYGRPVDGIRDEMVARRSPRRRPKFRDERSALGESPIPGTE
ncbi:hypothetical protein HWD35_10235 [Tsukamurella tyrosinosolvens]|uniref:hypothetical protein n=1 Tax=Tsukamurella tyrosinosolvens TaxID=57704 RepID=UPI001CE0C030|nr:hypothetical protein [Tsukamurella tyrosinosolvens]MCA4995089.1 hypothetical protein [Tsukamurella tyrosinosolvens]